MPHQPRIMYIEYKGGGLAGTARIGRVSYSKTGSTLYYGQQEFRSLKGDYKANYYDVATGERYWISGNKPAATASTPATSTSTKTCAKNTG